jgi:hypothetical protein
MSFNNSSFDVYQASSDVTYALVNASANYSLNNLDYNNFFQDILSRNLAKSNDYIKTRV